MPAWRRCELMSQMFPRRKRRQTTTACWRAIKCLRNQGRVFVACHYALDLSGALKHPGQGKAPAHRFWHERRIKEACISVWEVMAIVSAAHLDKCCTLPGAPVTSSIGGFQFARDATERTPAVRVLARLVLDISLQDCEGRLALCRAK